MDKLYELSMDEVEAAIIEQIQVNTVNNPEFSIMDVYGNSTAILAQLFNKLLVKREHNAQALIDTLVSRVSIGEVSNAVAVTGHSVLDAEKLLEFYYEFDSQVPMSVSIPLIYVWANFSKRHTVLTENDVLELEFCGHEKVKSDIMAMYSKHC